VGDDGSAVEGDGAVCGPATCAGCCANGVCLVGHINYACGLGGIACESCDVEKSCGPTGVCN